MSPLALLLGVESARELFDFALRVLQLVGTPTVQLFAPLPELCQLLEANVAALEPLDDLLQLRLGLLERHSLTAPKLPPATSTPSAVPAGGGLRTKLSPARTIA